MKTTDRPKRPPSSPKNPRAMRFKVYLVVDNKGTPLAVLSYEEEAAAALADHGQGDAHVLRLRVDGHPFALGMLRTQLFGLGITVPMSAVRVL